MRFPYQISWVHNDGHERNGAWGAEEYVRVVQVYEGRETVVRCAAGVAGGFRMGVKLAKVDELKYLESTVQSNTTEVNKRVQAGRSGWRRGRICNKSEREGLRDGSETWCGGWKHTAGGCQTSGFMVTDQIQNPGLARQVKDLVVISSHVPVEANFTAQITRAPFQQE